MKRLSYSKRLLCVLLLWCVPMYAAMTTSAAKKKAKELWGPFGAVDTIEQQDKSMIKRVGILTPGCAPKFQVFGEAPSDFAKAFASALADPPKIAGPFKGVIYLQGSAFDNIALDSQQWIVDGQDYQQPNPAIAEPLREMTYSTPIQTANLPDGLHYVCQRVKDKAGHVSVSPAILFRTNQLSGEIVQAWRPSTKDFAQWEVDAVPGIGAVEFLKSVN